MTRFLPSFQFGHPENPGQVIVTIGGAP